jgi:hypothetical protein
MKTHTQKYNKNCNFLDCIPGMWHNRKQMQNNKGFLLPSFLHVSTAFISAIAFILKFAVGIVKMSPHFFFIKSSLLSQNIAGKSIKNVRNKKGSVCEKSIKVLVMNLDEILERA